MAALVRGALELERTPNGLLPHRLPARARAQCTDAQLAMAEAQPSGVRLAFRTRAGRRWVATFVHDRDPGVTWFHDHATGEAACCGGPTRTWTPPRSPR